MYVRDALAELCFFFFGRKQNIFIGDPLEGGDKSNIKKINIKK